MRVRITETDIFEVNNICVSPCGKPTAENSEIHTDMMCYIEMRYGNGEYEYINGEFKCPKTGTFEECRLAAKKFVDELYENGCVDISTDELCEKYGISIW